MIEMLRYLFELMDAEGRRRLRLMAVLQAGQGVLQGLGFVFVTPLLVALLGDPIRWSAVAGWLGAIAVAVAAHHALLAVSTNLGYQVGADVLTGFHTRIGNHLSTLPIGWFRADRTGPIGRMLGKGTMDIANVPAHMLRYVIAGVVAPATMMIGALVLDWRIGAALVAGVAVCALALRLLMSIVRRNDDDYEADITVTASRIVEYARQQATLRAYGVLDRPELGTLEASLTAQQRSQSRLTLRGAGGMMVFFGAAQLVVTVVIAMAVAFAIGGTLAVPVLVGILILTLRMLDPIAQLGDLAGHVQVNADAIRRVRELLAVRPLPEPARTADPGGAEVEFAGVTFGYDPGRPVLRELSFGVRPKTLTAIVGPSGSGKTTVLRLVSRFFDVEDGEVRIGGADVRELGSAAVAGLTAPVFQDSYLFEGTIADNLRMAAPDSTPDDLDRAARLARLDEVLERLPDGWETRVGEGGATLSGGERQRVAIARALLKDAPIVLLDEATAALDPVNEAAVADAMSGLARDRTVIVVAHRLQTVVAADQILVLDAGRITETGTHEQLIAREGTYAAFWRERVRAKGWQLRSRK